MKAQEYEKKHLTRMRKYAPECMVLLKKNGAFPLKQMGKIALYGSGARKTIKGGTGSGDVNSRFYITVEQGLEKAGFTVTTKDWMDAYDKISADAKTAFVKEIKRQAKEQHVMALFLGMGAVVPEPEYELPLDGDGDTAVYVLSRICGEGNDRKPEKGDLKLTDTEVRDILACQKRYKNFMLVLNVGNVMDLSAVAEVENILILSQLGAVTGLALADVLTGKSVPSGKLTTTWSAWEDYAAIGDFAMQDDTVYREGIYVGYRYFDSVGKKALYPFGYGLSYTEFEITDTHIIIEETEITASVTVKNTGAYEGKEVVQLYVTAPWGRLDQPYQRLAAFAKTRMLHPGESETVQLTFCMADIASYDMEQSAYILEAGDYILRIGNSSQNTEICGTVKVMEEVLIRQLSRIGDWPETEPSVSEKGDSDSQMKEADWKPEYTWQTEISDDVPVLTVDKTVFEHLRWQQPAVISEKAVDFVKKLSDEELVLLCIGNHKSGFSLESVIGSASRTVAGAAGESTGSVEGIPALVMADGPAGIRISREYTKDKKGVHPVGESLPAGMSDYLPAIAKVFMGSGSKRKAKGEILEQNCTAIPIGTALAQSWNMELCEGCGEVVGEEMKRFGIHLWLAPAMNIHRSPLCGRNFEYYSEDPLISGLTAAAVTKGVQKYPGCGVTVKHFCCNNQETNRYQSNSAVSERALREIYLRGFELCIREADPASLMTSYNLLNGIHTCEREDLLKKVLREEWGYTGLVMSDWMVSGLRGKASKYETASPAPSVKGGNDVFMPGSSANYKEVLDALKGKHPKYQLTREEVEFCAAHLTELAWKLTLEAAQ